jgi:hypothetical protein
MIEVLPTPDSPTMTTFLSAFKFELRTLCGVSVLPLQQDMAEYGIIAT